MTFQSLSQTKNSYLGQTASLLPSITRQGFVQRRNSHPGATCSAVDLPTPKRALITGANTGIGFETAKALAGKGYSIALACRDMDKAKAAAAKLRDLVPGGRFECVPLDLANLQSVRDLSNKVLDGGVAFDLLINNAGVMACPEMQTADGFEYQLGVNHLGHFLLTTMLLPLLQNPDKPSRIVNVSSSAHTFGSINFDDINSRKDYAPWKAYGQSKLANVLFSYELARRLKLADNLTVNALHPGLVNTELARYLLPTNTSWWQKPVFKLLGAFAKTPEQGAQTSVYVASSPEIEGVTGKYFSNSRPETSSPESYDTEVARKLWELSLEMTAAKPVAVAAV